MSAPRLWRGDVLAAALVVDPALVGEVEARRRVAALWAPGARVERLGARGYLVHLAAPLRLRAERAPGLSLVRVGGVLSAVAASEAALAALGARAGDIVTPLAGAAVVAAPRTPVDPSAWLALDDELAVADVTSLGATGARAAAPAPTPIADARVALGTAIPARAARPDAEPAGALATRERPPLLARLRGALGSALAWLAARSRRPAAAPSSRQLGPPTPAAAPIELPAPPGPPSWLDRLRARLAAAAARLARLTQLDRALGRRQAAYVERMLRHFERGEWDEALRHGIPIDEVDKPGGAPKPPSLTVPRPRDDLRLGARAPATSSLGFGEGLFAHVRRTYREAFERLAAAGAHERAAFVLAELLDANEEAVAYLESHGLRREAAALAEARHLPPGLVVRQWFLAGDAARAVALARVHGVFADAVARLEKDHAGAAAALRAVWADHLATSGEYAAAVTVAWPEAHLRPLARAWIDRAVALGGQTGGAMLAHQLTLMPEDEAGLVARARTLLGGDDPAARVGLARGLAGVPDRPGLRALRRRAARLLVRDAGLGLSAIPVLVSEVQQLARVGGDVALAADLPSLVPARPRLRLAHHTTPEVHERHAGDTGREPVHDAVRLPDGRLLVAVGEAGVLLYDRSGRVLHRFDEPAHALVPADAGHSALAIARRGRGQMIARLDLATRRSERFWEAALGVWAPSHDGSMWFVASADETLHAIDVHAATPRALWSLRPGGEINRVQRTATQLVATIFDEPSIEAWEWELPGLVLRRRAPLVSPAFGRASDPDATVECTAFDDYWSVHLEVPGAGLPRALHLQPQPAGTPKLSVILAGTDSPRARLSASHFIVFDDRGRVLVFELAFGRLVAELRT